MILDEVVVITLTSSNMKWFKSKGYMCPHKGEHITVCVKDLMPTSRIKVRCSCDICGAIFYRSYIAVKDHRHTCGNQECKKILRTETFLERYNVTNPAFSKAFMKKAAETFKRNFGLQSSKHQEYVERRNNTNLQRHGNKRGNNGNQSQIIKTLYRNGKTADCKIGSFAPTSLAQIHLCKLFNGVLNEKIGTYKCDIVLHSDNIIIEYDGIGHCLYRQDIIDDQRDKYLIALGWRIIHLRYRKLLEDKVLLALISWSKNYFHNTTDTYIIINDDAITTNSGLYHINEVIK